VLVGGWLCRRALWNVLPTPTIVQGFFRPLRHLAHARRLWRLTDDALYTLWYTCVFYEEWTGGIGWERYEVPADKCPRISEAFLEEERAVLPSWVYRQEYDCSFEQTDDQVFTQEMVEAALSSDVKPLFGSA
jgi:hypothetical protein